MFLSGEMVAFSGHGRQRSGRQIADSKSLIVDSDGAIPQLPAVARRDPLADRVRHQIQQLMKANNNMEQRELARRAKEPYQRVNKLLRGQMPYPPMTFLNNLLGVFNYTLPEALAETVLPVRPLAQQAFRPLVHEIAELLERQDDAYLGHLKAVLIETRPRRRKR